jgi:elongation factor G
MANKPCVFVNKLYGNGIPPNFISSIEKGFLEATVAGPLTGHPVVGVRFVLVDGLAHEVDSNDLAFRLAAKGAFEQAYAAAIPVVLEPVMKVQAVGPSEAQAAILTTLTGRRGCIMSNQAVGAETQLVEASVPLRCMFGYTSELRGCTQGHGEFSIEFMEYQVMPGKNQEELEQRWKEKSKKRAVAEMVL